MLGEDREGFANALVLPATTLVAAGSRCDSKAAALRPRWAGKPIIPTAMALALLVIVKSCVKLVTRIHAVTVNALRMVLDTNPAPFNLSNFYVLSALSS